MLLNRKASLRLIAFCLLFAVFPLLAQSSRPKPVVLKSARLYDGKSNRMVSPGVVIVQGNMIAAIGPAAVVPADAIVIDLGEATLLPGFIDAHTHLGWPYAASYDQREMERMRKNAPELALDATVWVRKTLLAGFTTVRDLGSSDFIDVALRNAVADGSIIGPRMLVAVRGIGATGGHADDLSGYRYNLFGRESGIEDGVADGPEQIRKAVRWVVKNGADVVKVHVTGGVLSLTDDVQRPQLTQEEVNALVDEAHAMGRKTAAHAHSSEGARRAIRAGIDSIEHGTFLDDETLGHDEIQGHSPGANSNGYSGSQGATSEWDQSSSSYSSKGTRRHRQHEFDHGTGYRQRRDHRLGDRCLSLSAWQECRRVRPSGRDGDEAP